MNTTATLSKYLRSITQSDSSTFDPKLDNIPAYNIQANGQITFDPKTYTFNYKCKWKVNLTPNYVIHIDSAPNAFHRLMQRLLLGIKWTKIVS